MSGPPALDAPPKATDRDGVPVPSYAPGLSATGPQGLPSNASSKEEPLVSEADRYTIRGLLPIIRNPQSDHAMLSLGLDLTHLGLKLGADDDRLLSTLWLTPFADPNAPGGGGQVPLSSTDALANRFTPPACYVMGGISAVLPEASNKIANFTEETLFYIFYVQPRSKMQELAAQELTSRNWRFHKELGVWLTKEPGVEPSVRTATMERGQYIFWDASRWERVKKVFELFYEDLEDRFGSAHGVATEAGVPVQGQSQGHDL
jgi:CCR4-NOT transcription complex subunit 2